jgi:hypothetical protein
MDTTEALRRIRRITPMMRKDVETADLSFLVMEAANNTIPKGLEDASTPFSNIYLAGQNALALKLAMDLARIFDLSKNKQSPPEKQDKASIPVLAALRVDQMSKRVSLTTRENGFQALEDAA